ncbi:MAG: HD domain-containing protein [Candidatus Uhrbacteria bacterium]
MRLTPKIQTAINYAADKHRDQLRKGEKLPNIVHPFSVAWILADAGVDEDVVVAGLLHDILEDVKGSSFEELSQKFGERVASIVRDVSEDKDPNIESDEKLTWMERKQKYLAHLSIASSDAVLVSVADKIQNLQSMKSDYDLHGEALWDSFNSPPDKKLWFYEEVLRIASEKHPDHMLLAELHGALEDMRRASNIA